MVARTVRSVRKRPQTSDPDQAWGRPNVVWSGANGWSFAVWDPSGSDPGFDVADRDASP